MTTPPMLGLNCLTRVSYRANRQRFELAWNGSERIHAWLDIIPDDFYATQVFPELIASLPSDGAANRLAHEALATARASSFTLYETELRRP
jgi:hypothetical protein